MRPWLRIEVCDSIPQGFTSSDVACYHPAKRTIWIIRRLPKLQFVWTLIHELGHWLLDLAGCRSNQHHHYDRLWKVLDPYPVNREALGIATNHSNFTAGR